MYQYSNAFTYTANPESGEFLLTFLQQHPVFNDERTVSGVAADTVAEIMMSRAGFEALRQLLDQVKLD